MASYTESFGIVLIEAQSFGIPCVAFDSARGALEIIEDSKNGYLIPDRNFEKMSEKLNLLIEDAGLRERLGKEARKNSLQYSEEVIQKLWFEFIENM